MQEHANMREKEVREVAHDLCITLNFVAKKANYHSLFKKYSLIKYQRVALIPERIREQSLAAERQP